MRRRSSRALEGPSTTPSGRTRTPFSRSRRRSVGHVRDPPRTGTDRRVGRGRARACRPGTRGPGSGDSRARQRRAAAATDECSTRPAQLADSLGRRRAAVVRARRSEPDRVRGRRSRESGDVELTSGWSSSADRRSRPSVRGVRERCARGGRARRLRESAGAHRASRDLARRLSPHHRVHTVSLELELADVSGTGRSSRPRPRVWDLVSANLATPCVRNPRDLLLCSAAHVCSGDESRAEALERDAVGSRAKGFESYLSGPRLRIALVRGDRQPPRIPRETDGADERLGRRGDRRARRRARGAPTFGPRRERGGVAPRRSVRPRAVRAARARRRRDTTTSCSRRPTSSSPRSASSGTARRPSVCSPVSSRGAASGARAARARARSGGRGAPRTRSRRPRTASRRRSSR